MQNSEEESINKHGAFRAATLLGFVEQVEEQEELSLSKLRSLADFLKYLQEYNQSLVYSQQ